MHGIEFRFLVVHRNDYFKTEKEQVLQYRVKEDTTAYAGLSPFPAEAARIERSKWIDVPIVHEYE